MTDVPHEPDATPEEAAEARRDERSEPHADPAGDSAGDDAIVIDDTGAQASAAATAAARAASDRAPTSGADGDVASDGDALDDEVTDHGNAFDLEALAEADPRSKSELLGELVLAENKRDEYLDDLRRSHADFENYRRRITREGAAQRDAGKADLAGPLLEVLDDLDRTLVAADGSSDKDLAKGVALVASKFTTTLSRVGLERVEATGVPFDPNVHEAVQQQPADEPTEVPVVVQVLRPGYRLGQRTLRPAMVVVEQ